MAAVEVAPARIGTAVRLGWAVAGTAAGAGLVTVAVPGLLRGPAVMNGSARGTALVLLLVGVPALGLALRAAVHGSARAEVVCLGVLAYAGYNATLFLYATPFNRAFPLYVVLAGLTFWAVVAFLAGYDTTAPLAGAVLVMWPIESVGVAVDQWWGHAADPSSPVASAAAVPMFLALVGLVPLAAYFHAWRPTPGPPR
jgi:hypothetical protein